MKSNKPKIGIIGIGMVGGPIKKWFEEHHKYRRGKELFCYDADIKKGYRDDINKADFIFVAVPTPPNVDGSCNTSIVTSAVSKIKDRKVIIIKSTVTPGTVEALQKKYPGKKFIFNPEFLTEANAWQDFIKPDRQIIGHTQKSLANIKKLVSLLPKAIYNPHYSNKNINATEAELAKYGSNVFGYIKVIYGNILADISHVMGVDYENIREAISADPRIGPSWLKVNHGNYSGAGGFCFPKDMNAMINFMEGLLKDVPKKKTDPGLIASLKKGLAVLKAIADYNKTLLSWQGLTLEDVSYHDKDILTNKRKSIRTR